MKQIIEISRRSMFYEESGIACGPVSSVAINAEIVLEVDGQSVYLFGEWCDIAGEYYFDATTESIYEATIKMYNAESEEEQEAAIAERDRISCKEVDDASIFEPYYDELTEMIHAEMKAHGMEYFYEDEEEEDEEDEDEGDEES